MSTETLTKHNLKALAQRRWFTFVDAHLPSLFIGAYVLGMGILIAVLMLTGRLHD